MSPNLPRCVAIGEALTDMICLGGDQWISKTGGSTWNVARAVAACGVRSAFAGAISRCCFGDALWSASEQAGIDLRFLQRTDHSPLLAIVYQTDPPRYFFIGDDSADLHFAPEQLPAGWRQTAEWAHFGGISLAREPLAGRLVALAGELHAQGMRISYDPNYRNLMQTGYRPVFEAMCRLADVIKLSDEDLAGLMPIDPAQIKTDTVRAEPVEARSFFDCSTGSQLRTNGFQSDSGGINNNSPSQTLAEVMQWNPGAWWLYTEGAKGATLFTPHGAWHAAAPEVTVVDTVGAGDACIAALVASRLDWPDRSPAQHLAAAVAAGSAACQHAGATPPTLEAIQTMMGNIETVVLKD